MRYNNYHKHDHKGNVKSLDVVCKMEDYCKRAIELGHTTIFTTNHGIQGDIFEATTLAKKYGLKLIVGAECYYVKDRKEKDRSNRHIIIICLNDNAVRQLNKILSIANVEGFYYKPRIDYELLMSLNEKDFIITTACVAGILKDKELVLELHHKFKDNFFVEVQNHNDPLQKEFNELALKYNNEYGIKLIHANDSHYIYPEEAKYRDLFLKAKGIIYEEESEFTLDYPDAKTIADRYILQGVLNKDQIFEAINNTLVFDKAENLTIINDDIKLPNVSDNPKKEFRDILTHEWDKEKKFIPKNRWEEYMEAIRYETSIVDQTNMHQYFILNYKVIKNGVQKYGGVISRTGRGSSPSFYINKLFGLVNIDRLDSPIKLYPTRFMSAERILLARSLPDIDFNTVSREPFIKATEDLLGAENCAWMISWKPLQNSSGFRLWCKANDMNINEYDEIAKNIDDYRNDEYWGSIIKESEKFVGVVESISESPCSMVVYDKDVSEEIGLIRTEGRICCLLDGYNCDVYKYLKNDLLQVTIWDTISDTYKLLNMPIPTIREFNKLLDDKTFDIYEKGLTCTINQVDSDWATGIVKKYKPRSLDEMSAFVAAIRPGFASLLDNFINRREYTTGVKELDDILKDSYHYLMYQESIMSYLIYCGIDEKETYDIIKKIAKKKFKEKELEELKKQLKHGWINAVGKEEGFDETWQVVEDASRYSFNASHSLSYAYDSLYGAYLKAHYPLEYYATVFNKFTGDERRTTNLTKELEYFGIKLYNPKFRYSKATYHPDKESNSIYKGLASIKYMNEKVADELYSLKDCVFDDFIDVLETVHECTSINSRQLDILIKLDFFSEFGKSQKLLDITAAYDEIYSKKQFKKDKLPLGLSEEIVRIYAAKETEKMFMQVETRLLLKKIIQAIPNKSISMESIFANHLEFVGYCSYVDESYDERVCVISDLKTNKWGTAFATLYKLKDGKSMTLKVDKNYFANKPLKKFDVIRVAFISENFKRRKINGKWILTDDKEHVLERYSMVLEEE